MPNVLTRKPRHPFAPDDLVRAIEPSRAPGGGAACRVDRGRRGRAPGSGGLCLKTTPPGWARSRHEE